MDSDNRISFSCPSCGRQLIVDARYAGKKGRCPGCKHVFTIPANANIDGEERKPIPPSSQQNDSCERASTKTDYATQEAEQMRRVLGPVHRQESATAGQNVAGARDVTAHRTQYLLPKGIKATNRNLVVGIVAFGIIGVIAWFSGIGTKAADSLTQLFCCGFVPILIVAAIIADNRLKKERENHMRINAQCVRDDKLAEIKEKLNQIVDFTPMQKLMSVDAESGLAVDETRRKLCLIYRNQRSLEFEVRVVAYSDLLSCELFEDSITTTKTDNSNQIGRAVVGGFLLGEAGAIIGGVSAKKTTSKEVKRIDLRLTINDTKNPIHVITLLNLLAHDAALYETALSKAKRWQALIEVIIRQGYHKEKPHIAPNATVQPRESLADELKKLVELRDSGAISADEFDRLKARLLNEGSNDVG